MGFFNRGKNQPEKKGGDSTFSSNELLGSATEESVEERTVKTALFIHPAIEINVEDKYYLQFLNNELPLLKENQVSLSGIDLISDGANILVSAFIRNSLAKAIQFDKLPLLLLGGNEEVLARNEFDLSQLGEIPAESSVPWKFSFPISEQNPAEIPQNGWKIAFELKTPHTLELEESWEKNLEESEKNKLRDMINTLSPPKSGEVNFMGLQAQQSQNGNLHITMLIRNGSDKSIKLEQIPLIVEDATGDVIAKGGFTLESFEVRNNTSKPWTFIFPKELILKEELDLSSFKAYPPQN
ncbi:accessory Sec system S-layer assembly protein [Peribacillus loiseleuriae]|uniref:accessory Sec system S-layer assembly protein n=1 Tax=Peribacillus loiseleuriae TaxID=1679170 RepID=UPI003D01F942